MKTPKTEISVEEAAKILQVTPRTVINYLRAKEIVAVKVGKSVVYQPRITGGICPAPWTRTSTIPSS